MRLFMNLRQGGTWLNNLRGGGVFFWKKKHSWKIIKEKNSTYLVTQ